jgi:xanthine dehydrogenase accessory factor
LSRRYRIILACSLLLNIFIYIAWRGLTTDFNPLLPRRRFWAGDREKRNVKTWINLNRARRPLAIVLGTNEIASAVAIHLHRMRYAVILSRDPFPPVIRRGMAFDDALYGEPKAVEGILAIAFDKIADAPAIHAKPQQVAITHMGLTDLLMLGPLDVLVDARLHKHAVTPDFRGLARIMIGLGPGFTVRKNCDLAIETKPVAAGALVEDGTTQAADGTPELLAGAGRERFVYTPYEGFWRTPFEIGGRVYKNMLIGHLDGERICAPIDGVLRGIARDGTEMPKGVKLVEVDPRIYRRRQTFIEERPRLIAEATLRAVHVLDMHHRTASPMPGMLLN